MPHVVLPHLACRICDGCRRRAVLSRTRESRGGFREPCIQQARHTQTQMTARAQGDKRLVVYAGAKRLLVADCNSGSLIECEQPHSERISALARRKFTLKNQYIVP